MRQFALPRNDKSILDRGNYIPSKSSCNLGRLVKEQLVILQEYPSLLPDD
jgi:hypothetical protein